MTTIKDVAKLAEVSVATVSRVLNKNGYVHSETEKRVAYAIKQLNYKPNDVARSLFKGRSKMIALLVPDIMNPFFPELARAVEDMTKQHNFTFVLCNTDDDIDKEMAYLDALKQKSVDGIIIVSSTISADNISGMGTPIVALDRILSSSLSSVTVNNYVGAKEAVQHLKAIGCKRIAHISGPENVSNAKQRLKGYLEEVQDEEWFLPSYIEQGEYHFEDAKEATKKLLTTHRDIDGLFVANDLMGVGALKAAESLGIKVPEELSIIAFDGISLGETTSPALTTMAQPIYQAGAKAAEIIIEQIENQHSFVTNEEFSVKLVERQSTKFGRSSL
ncbi:LacI family DNA-binding transcriptional regulator [Halobacillus naozhouensis]|uniref:LacI family DNA-binding transcriptional regulator n=1 Tax=Halobacillus naozhouensis TaxID=554880 RepID=A0ABY8IVN4_9BACI|nr:LacI family DNA-binding transcriptional regulator [Halobacillus naozhouensis]WFT74249.1 LacI family DNA-binding transcriptional regulator [Halobacillus naozhouensis]